MGAQFTLSAAERITLTTHPAEMAHEAKYKKSWIIAITEEAYVTMSNE